MASTEPVCEWGGGRVITNVRQTLLTMGWVGCNLTHVETEFEEKFD